MHMLYFCYLERISKYLVVAWEAAARCGTLITAAVSRSMMKLGPSNSWRPVNFFEATETFDMEPASLSDPSQSRRD